MIRDPNISLTTDELEEHKDDFFEVPIPSCMSGDYGIAMSSEPIH